MFKIVDIDPVEDILELLLISDKNDEYLV